MVASPEDLTAGWSYSALSRARGTTRLLIDDQDRRDRVRAELGPDRTRPTQLCSEVLARATRRMLIRDDEDLAVDQITAAGHEDDRALASHRVVGGSPPQEFAADHAEPIDPAPSMRRLLELREQIGRQQLVLEALLTKPLARLDELDAKERDLVAQRTEREERLSALEPPARRLGRVRDAHAEERAFLRTAIEMDDRALSEIRADRARLQRELGDSEQIRSERDGIENAIATLRRDHDEVRDDLAEHTIKRRPQWLIQTIGERPAGNRQRETWDKAARALANFRLHNHIIEDHAPLGHEPPDGGEQHLQWQQANAALERAQRQLGREAPTRDRHIDLGMG